MIKKGKIKLSDVVFVYFKSPEQSLVGVVVKIDHPIITIKTVRKNKYKDRECLDISKNIALTILNEDMVKKYLTPKEIQTVKKIEVESSIVDLFEGMY